MLYLAVRRHSIAIEEEQYGTKRFLSKQLFSQEPACVGRTSRELGEGQRGSRRTAGWRGKPCFQGGRDCGSRFGTLSCGHSRGGVVLYFVGDRERGRDNAGTGNCQQ